jgi:hypothetical protein
MKQCTPRWRGLGHAVLVAGYVALVAFFMSYIEVFFGKGPDSALGGKQWLFPMTFLMILVFSATVVGTLIFARPVMLYLDNKKQEALAMLAYTIGWLFVLVVAVLAVVAAVV